MKYYEVDENLSGPIQKVNEWVQEAELDSVALPHAMNVSSINHQGKPSSRMVFCAFGLLLTSFMVRSLATIAL